MQALSKIATAAGRRDLPFILAGGHAVIIHGFPRTTYDLDLVVRKSDADEWVKLASDISYSLLHRGPAFLQFKSCEETTEPLDLIVVSDQTFAQMQELSVQNQAALKGIFVVSLKHLLAMKCHAVKHGHPGRVLKDAEDVIQLILTNHLDPESQEMRELFVKHGTTEFYEKVRSACRAG